MNSRIAVVPICMNSISKLNAVRYNQVDIKMNLSCYYAMLTA